MSASLTKQARKHQALLNALLENVTTVQVRFEPSGMAKSYTYKAPKHWNVVAGDQLVVDSPNSGMTVVKVVSVDAVPQLDPDADFAYKWAVQKVDTTAYTAQLMREKLFLEQMSVVEREHARQETLSKATAALQGDALESFKAAVKLLTGKAEDVQEASASGVTTAS